MDLFYLIAAATCVLLFAVPIFLPIYLMISKNRKDKRNVAKVEQYLMRERIPLLTQVFPGWEFPTMQTYMDSKNRKKLPFQDYIFQMKILNNRQYRLELEQNIETSEGSIQPGYDSSPTTYNCYLTLSVNPIMQIQKCLPGSFVTVPNTISIMRGLDSIAAHIAKLRNETQRMEEYQQNKVSGNIKIGYVGQVYYHNIPWQIWKIFASHSLPQIEQLLILWKPIADASLGYSEKGGLYLKITAKSNQLRLYQCLEEDFILDKAQMIHQSIQMLLVIAESVYHMNSYISQST